MKKLIFLLITMLVATNAYSDTIWSTGTYSNNENRSETLSISGVSSLTVTIAGEVEQGYDYITIFDGNGAQAGRFTGQINETLTVNTSSIRAVLTSDGSVVKSGVTVSITTATTNPPPTNGNTSWTTGTYSNNENRSETLSISGASSLTVTIAGEVEQGYDYITIFDGNGTQAGRFTGQINQTLTVNTSSIRAVLTTDGSVVKSGVTVSISTSTTNPTDPLILLLGS